MIHRHATSIDDDGKFPFHGKDTGKDTPAADPKGRGFPAAVATELPSPAHGQAHHWVTGVRPASQRASAGDPLPGPHGFTRTRHSRVHQLTTHDALSGPGAPAVDSHYTGHGFVTMAGTDADSQTDTSARMPQLRTQPVPRPAPMGRRHPDRTGCRPVRSQTHDCPINGCKSTWWNRQTRPPGGRAFHEPCGRRTLHGNPECACGTVRYGHEILWLCLRGDRREIADLRACDLGPGNLLCDGERPLREAQAQAPFLILCIHELGNLGFLDVPVANDEEEEFDPTDPGDGDDPDCGA